MKEQVSGQDYSISNIVKSSHKDFENKGVKCCLPEKAGVLLYFSIYFAKSWSQRQKIGVKYSEFWS